jgi:hypothetical protein
MLRSYHTGEETVKALYKDCQVFQPFLLRVGAAPNTVQIVHAPGGAPGRMTLGCNFRRIRKGGPGSEPGCHQPGDKCTSDVSGPRAFWRAGSEPFWGRRHQCHLGLFYFLSLAFSKPLRSNFAPVMNWIICSLVRPRKRNEAHRTHHRFCRRTEDTCRRRGSCKCVLVRWECTKPGALIPLHTAGSTRSGFGPTPLPALD